jgi:hypothetical protein
VLLETETVRAAMTIIASTPDVRDGDNPRDIEQLKRLNLIA